MPMGGIGVGFLDVAPDGSIKRVAINNHHQDGVLTDTAEGTFASVWSEHHGPVLLQRARLSGAASVIPPAAHIRNFTGLFPTASFTVEGPPAVSGQSVTARMDAWSALVPHEIANSSLPLAWFEVTLVNNEATPVAMAAGLSFQDVISRGIFDATMDQLARHYPTPVLPTQCALQVNNLCQNIDAAGESKLLSRAHTVAERFNASGYVGVVQRTIDGGALARTKRTLQHYVDHVALVAELPHQTTRCVSGCV